MLSTSRQMWFSPFASRAGRAVAGGLRKQLDILRVGDAEIHEPELSVALEPEHLLKTELVAIEIERAVDVLHADRDVPDADDVLHSTSLGRQSRPYFANTFRTSAPLRIWSRTASSTPPISSAFDRTSSTRGGNDHDTVHVAEDPVAGIDAHDRRQAAARRRSASRSRGCARARLRFDRRQVAREDRPVGNVEEEIAVAHAAVDDDAGSAARLRGGRHQLAPVPRLPIAGGGHEHDAARIHALEEVEGRDFGEIVYSTSLRGSAAAAMVKAGPAIRIAPVDRLDVEVEALMRQPHLVHDVVDGRGIELLQARRGRGDHHRGSAPRPSFPRDADSVRRPVQL